MRIDSDCVRPDDWSMGHKVIHDLGFFGHFLHFTAGGRSGQKHVITYLSFHDGHMSQRELQDRLEISSGALSEVLAKVEADGLIERTRSEADRRLQEVRLTERGHELALTYAEERGSFEDACLSCFDEAEQAQLLTLLDRLVDHWKALAKERGAAKGSEGVLA